MITDMKTKLINALAMIFLLVAFSTTAAASDPKDFMVNQDSFLAYVEMDEYSTVFIFDHDCPFDSAYRNNKPLAALEYMEETGNIAEVCVAISTSMMVVYSRFGDQRMVDSERMKFDFEYKSENE